MPKFGDAFEEFSELGVPKGIPAVVKEDPDDDKFLACAEGGGADCLVSGDSPLLQIGNYKGMPILKPADFLMRYFPDQ